VFLFQAGGNDGENTLVPVRHHRIPAVRVGADAGVRHQHPAGQLAPIQPLNLATPFGFHPACAPLKALFDQRRLAVVANVGVLALPSARAGLENGSMKRPANLFSHPDQELALQSGDPNGFTRTGWGGRLADRLEAAAPQSLFPALTSINALKTWTAGATSIR
jgi:uncharacterized protein (DUF1501 family)